MEGTENNPNKPLDEIKEVVESDEIPTLDPDQNTPKSNLGNDELAAIPEMPDILGDDEDLDTTKSEAPKNQNLVQDPSN